jgi:hypothetical protein
VQPGVHLHANDARKLAGWLVLVHEEGWLSFSRFSQTTRHALDGLDVNYILLTTITRPLQVVYGMKLVCLHQQPS